MRRRKVLPAVRGHTAALFVAGRITHRQSGLDEKAPLLDRGLPRRRGGLVQVAFAIPHLLHRRMLSGADSLRRRVWVGGEKSV